MSYLEPRDLARIRTQVWLARLALQGLLTEAQDDASRVEEHGLLHRVGIAIDRLEEAERIIGDGIGSLNTWRGDDREGRIRQAARVDQPEGPEPEGPPPDPPEPAA